MLHPYISQLDYFNTNLKPLLHLQTSQHLLVRWAQLTEIFVWSNEQQVEEPTLRTRRRYQPIAFGHRLAVVLNRGRAYQGCGAALCVAHLDGTHAAGNPHAGIGLLKAL